MTINFDPIFSGMQNGPDKINLNFNEVKTELERMNGDVVTIPKEQFTALNGTNLDPNIRNGCIFKFNNFAIVSFHMYVKVTMKGWTDREAVSIPKSYVNGYSKFEMFGDHRRYGFDNDGAQFEIDFHLDTGTLSIYTRDAEWDNKGAAINVSGILYN
ncbi:hypothetical protein [Ligilactobacillus agilis]|uniref:hypothetical protein n=1 Tax=Ligilactobacillus agilis TaxID=1601 RepID=UPI0022E0CF47|nr:hypothetical protein [Ligilactobacillus agilis]